MHLINFQITGFNCSACAKLANLELTEVDGVESVKIAEDGRCEIKANRQILLEEFENKLSNIGFGVTK